MSLPASAAVYAAFGIWGLTAFLVIAPRRNARGVIACLIGAWLFLPQATIRFPYIFYTTKSIVVALVLLAAVCVLDFRRVKRFRPHWVDVPMGLFCTVPFFSALANGVGLDDALRFLLEQLCAWGIPFFLGRVYLTDASALRELAIGIVIGGCVYLPLCWFEIFAGPKLHVWLYGFPPSPLEMAVRYGGWRPIVFQLHGLMTGLYMAAATVCAFWLWRTRAALALYKIPMLWIFLGLAVTTIALKSVNGWALGTLGIVFLLLSAYLSPAKMVGVLATGIVAYLALRITGTWNARELVGIGQLIADKELSIYYRVTFETVIAERARAQWLLGWGTNDRAMVRNYLAHSQTISDSYWIAVYGMWGLTGLVTWLLASLTPLLLFLKAFAGALWSGPRFAPAAALFTLFLMFFLDAMLNTMLNPIYIFALGGLVSISLAHIFSRRNERVQEGQAYRSEKAERKIMA